MLRRGARAGIVAAHPRRPFTMQTLGRGGHLRGVIAIAAGDLDQEARGVVTAVVAMAALALEQHQGLARAQRALRAGLVQSLLTGDPARAADPRDLWGRFPAPPSSWAVTIRRPRARTPSPNGSAPRGRDEGGRVLRPRRGRPRHRESRRRGVDERATLAECGSASRSPSRTRSSATRTHRRRRRSPWAEPLTRFREIAASGVLSALDSEAARSLAAARLAPLREHDTSEGTALVETVRVWLEQDARIDAAATALGVHRHTVRARIGLAVLVLRHRPRVVRGTRGPLGGASGRPRFRPDADPGRTLAHNGGRSTDTPQLAGVSVGIPATAHSPPDGGG